MLLLDRVRAEEAEHLNTDTLKSVRRRVAFFGIEYACADVAVEDVWMVDLALHRDLWSRERVAVAELDGKVKWSFTIRAEHQTGSLERGLVLDVELDARVWLALELGDVVHQALVEDRSVRDGISHIAVHLGLLRSS